MKLNIKNLTIQDIIAMLVMIGGFYLIATGKNGLTGNLMTLVITFYFVRWRPQGNQ